MIPSIKGGWLPESAEDFAVLQIGRAVRFARCFDCKEPIGPANTRSAAGWRETQISGRCEDCFEELFKEDEAQESGVDQL
jgi:hypothetical protein